MKRRQFVQTLGAGSAAVASLGVAISWRKSAARENQYRTGPRATRAFP